MSSESSSLGALRGRLVVGVLLAGSAACLPAQTTISADDRYVYGGNIGWIDARPSAADGARVAEHVCSGYLYSANVGWIHLGDGSPENGRVYNNVSASDYGVNVSTWTVGGGTPGALLGYAYGANIGWILFTPAGAPRIDLTTGRLSGYAYSANVGWIQLGEFTLSVATNAIAPAPDSDGDGLPDAWELFHFPGLGSVEAAGDYDGDGASNGAEYLADTDPTARSDHFRVQAFSFGPAAAGPGFDTATVSFTSRATRRYRVELAPSLVGDWVDSALGRIAPDSGVSTTRVVATGTQSPTLFMRVRVEKPLAP